MEIPIQTIFDHENTQADRIGLWSRLFLVQNFEVYMCLFKNPYEKTRPDKKAYDPDFGSLKLRED